MVLGDSEPEWEIRICKKHSTSNREEKPDCLEICRRFLADEKDFSEIDDLPFNFRGYININQTHHIDLMIALEKDINR